MNKINNIRVTIILPYSKTWLGAIIHITLYIVLHNTHKIYTYNTYTNFIRKN